MTDMRKCIGSTKFGIEAHEVPSENFPAQPSQKDGLGRMCIAHWKQYVRALGQAAKARKDAVVEVATEAAPTVPDPAAAKKARAAKLEPIRTRAPRGRRQATPAAGSQGDAG